MIDITFVLSTITVLFLLFLIVQKVFSVKVCALCGAVSVTWITLLLLFYSGISISPVLIGVLMGGSVVGVMYALERKLNQEYSIFKVPFFLTLIALSYFVLEKSFDYKPIVLLAILWALSFIVFIKRDTGYFKSLSKRIINCCKNW